MLGSKHDTHFKICIYLDTSLAGVIEGKAYFFSESFQKNVSQCLLLCVCNLISPG